MSKVSKIDKFLEELKNVSEKYSLYIGGCGFAVLLKVGEEQ